MCRCAVDVVVVLTASTSRRSFADLTLSLFSLSESGSLSNNKDNDFSSTLFRAMDGLNVVQFFRCARQSHAEFMESSC